MRRRRFLTVCGGCVTAILAGCTAPDSSLDSTRGERRHPLADTTATVRIENDSDTDHDVERNAREALAFWEAHSEQYVGFEIAFDVVTEGEPTIAIEYVDTPERCASVANYSERVLGCAPLITPEHTLSDTATAIVVAGARPFGKIRITTKHEIGHILGLGHDDEPLEIMSNQPEHRIPLYALRIQIWETVLEGHERSSEAITLFSHGTSTWSDGQYEAAEAAFREAHIAFSAIRQLFEDVLEQTTEFDGHPQVETVALEDLRTHLDQLIRRMTAAEGVTDRMANAAGAIVAGNTTQANEFRSQANDFIDEFNDIGSPELRNIAIALGLVRGFDRDEDIVDIDEDEI